MHLQNWFSHPQDAIFFPNSWFLEKNASLIQHFPNVRCFTCILYFHFWNNLCPQKKVASHAKRIPNFSACISPINEENCCRFTKEVTIAAKCIFMQTRDALGGLSHKKEPAQWASSSSMPAAGVEPALPLGERDFKSRASANSAMPAGIWKDLIFIKSFFMFAAAAIWPPPVPPVTAQVDPRGLEPRTDRLWAGSSNQLS